MTATIRRWGTAMTDEHLAACRTDIDNADREQLAQDVGDLLDEVDHLRFLVRALASRADRRAEGEQ